MICLETFCSVDHICHKNDPNFWIASSFLGCVPLAFQLLLSACDRNLLWFFQRLKESHRFFNHIRKVEFSTQFRAPTSDCRSVRHVQPKNPNLIGTHLSAIHMLSGLILFCEDMRWHQVWTSLMEGLRCCGFMQPRSCSCWNSVHHLCNIWEFVD